MMHQMSHANYLTAPGLSASGIRHLLRSPAHYRAAIAEPTPPTPQQQLGTLVHAAILEPDRDLIAIQPDVDRRTKAGKEAYAEFTAGLRPDQIPVDQATADTVQRCRDAVFAVPFARALLADGTAEQSIFWDVDGVPCKARLDWISNGHAVVIDIKTTADASFEAFARSAARYAYHCQGAWYLRAAEQAGYGRRAFIVIAVETAPPFGVALYALDDESIAHGDAWCDRALNIYRDCMQSDSWPSYPAEIQTLSLPKWGL